MKSIKAKLVTAWNEQDWTPLETQDVEVLTWDRDKCFMYEGENGEVHTAKCYHFIFKRSNRVYELPDITWAWGECVPSAQKTRKEASIEVKKSYKRRAVYEVTSDGVRKEFKSLSKALSFCKSNPDATFLHASFDYKNGFQSRPLLEKESDQWYYFGTGTGRSERVSYKTLNKFCMEN